MYDLTSSLSVVDPDSTGSKGHFGDGESCGAMSRAAGKNLRTYGLSWRDLNLLFVTGEVIPLYPRSYSFLQTSHQQDRHSKSSSILQHFDAKEQMRDCFKAKGFLLGQGFSFMHIFTMSAGR